MKFNIHGSKVEITEAIKTRVEDKIGKLDKYFDQPETLTATVYIKEQGINKIVEVTIPAKKFILRGEVKDKNLYTAIDLVLDKLERQIRKNKTRMRRNNKKSPIMDFRVDLDTEMEQDETTIVKRKMIEMKPMSEEEALLQMNLLDHNFYIFKDSDTNNVAVIYQRQDGNYGIIELK